MISDNHDNETIPQCTKTKAVFEKVQKEEDLNNNSVNKTEAPKPQ